MTLNVIILVMISRRIDEDVVTDHLTAFVSLFVGFSQNIVWISLLSNDDKRV